MTIKFIDLDKAEDPLLKPHMSSVGYVWFEPGGTWHAFRPATGFRKTSDGSIRDLDPGLWLSNLGYERTQVFAKGVSHIALKSDEWMKSGSDHILSSLGLQDESARKCAEALAVVSDRIFRLAQDVIRLRYPDPRTVSAIIRRIERAPSLATGLQNAYHEDLARSRPSEKRILDVLEQTHQHGMYCFGRKKPGEGQVNLAFQFPKVSYAIEICGGRVPDKSVWQIASRNDSVSSKDFMTEIEEMQRPTIYRATYVRNRIPEHIESFIGMNRQSGAYRSLFLADEIRHLERHSEVSIESVIAGSGWKETSVGALVSLLVDVCGGIEVAARCWSAGFLVENILASVFRKINTDKGGKLVEPVWLAARDRSRMLPVISDLVDVGSALVSAQIGTIIVQCPADPELLTPLVDTAWRHGLHLSAHEAEMVAALGVEVPVSRSTFGGSETDYILSAISHGRKTRAMLSLDKAIDVPVGDRLHVLRGMLS